MSQSCYDDMIDPSAAKPPMGLEGVKKLLDEADFINGAFNHYGPDYQLQDRFGWSSISKLRAEAGYEPFGLKQFEFMKVPAGEIERLAKDLAERVAETNMAISHPIKIVWDVAKMTAWRTQEPERQHMVDGALLPESRIAALADYTPPSVLNRRPRKVAVCVDNGYDFWND